MKVWGGGKGRKVYGARKIWLELNSQGIPVARCTVERLMRELGIRGVSPGRKRPPTTLPGDPADRPSDLLERCFDAAAPNRRWVADITYVRLLEEFAYLAVVLDAFSRAVIGWAMADHLRASLAMAALNMALEERRPAWGSLIHHSDRGVQYACGDYTKALEAHGIAASMSRVGNPYDNAKAESFMKTLKQEEVDGSAYRDVTDARARIGCFIETVYNRQRLHSALDYLSPEEYEENAPRVRRAVPPTSLSITETCP